MAVFSRFRESFGGRLRFVISGGAALHPGVGEFFRVAGIEILQGYGLTESAAATTLSRLCGGQAPGGRAPRPRGKQAGKTPRRAPTTDGSDITFLAQPARAGGLQDLAWLAGHWITEDGAENLSAELPVQTEEIEALMG